MIALYSRVSTQEQATEGYSIGEQQERLRSCALSFGWKDFKLYTDPGFSGASLDRPAMQEMIRDVKAGKIQKVVVYKLDRLSRSQKDTLELIEDVFLAHGCEFVSMSESFDTSTPFGRASVGILAVFAQLERDTIRERMTVGRVGRAKSGLYSGSDRVPIGYDYKDGLLVVNDFEAAQVRELFRLYLAGKPLREILDVFNGRGYKTKNGVWQRNTMLSLLHSRTYIGEVKFSGVWYPGIHEPIIDRETFDAVQDLLESRRRDYSEKGTKVYGSDFLLLGLVYCRRCGARFSSKDNGSGIVYYKCRSRIKKKEAAAKGIVCDAPPIRREALEGLILDQIRQLAFDPGFLEEIKKKAEKENPDERPALREEIEKLDRKISRLLDLYAAGSFDADELTKKTESFREARQKLEKRLEALEARNPSLAPEKVAESLRGFSDVVDRFDRDRLRLVIRGLIRRIEIDGEDVFIYWNFN